MIPVDGWKDLYADLVALIHDSGLRPERFTLGTLRFFPTVQRLANEPESEVFSMVTAHGDPDDRRRVPEHVREAMYCFVMREIKQAFRDFPIGICKETEAMRARIGVDHDLCNCTL